MADIKAQKQQIDAAAEEAKENLDEQDQQQHADADAAAAAVEKAAQEKADQIRRDAQS